MDGEVMMENCGVHWLENKHISKIEMVWDEEQLVKKVVDMEVGQILVGRPMKS